MSATSSSTTDARPSQRAAQKASTRERIIDGLVTQLAGGTGDLSIDRLAAAVGVSPRTVYVHFPDREALLSALDDRVNKELLLQPEYESPEDFAERAGDEFADAVVNADLIRAQLRSRAGREVRGRSRSARAARVRDVLAPVLDPLPEGEAREAFAILMLLRGLDGWKVLHDDLGLSREEGARAVTWALSTLINDLQARGRATR